jgi:Raf kinase inhibitor-like YbhB/YbcL family protein
LPNPIGVLLRHRRAGQDTLAWARPDLQAPENLTLTSPAFADGTPIPARNRGHLLAANVSPALVWTPPPTGTEELVLIVQDPDAPRKQPAIHALAAGLDPVLPGLRENALSNPSPVRGLRHGRGTLGHRGWFGPAPVPSHGPHTYVFQLFALDRRLELPEDFTLVDALDAMAGHVLGRARLDGTYEIR